MKIPKEFMKGKIVPFYKFSIMYNGDEMVVNTGGDVFALDPTHAVLELFNSMTADKVKDLLFDGLRDTINTTFVLLTVHLAKDDVTDRYLNSMLDDGSKTIILKLSDDHYTIDLQNFKMENIEVKYDNDGVGKVVQHFKFISEDENGLIKEIVYN